MKIKLLLIAEIEGTGCNPLAMAAAKLDAFREAVPPAAEYGITLFLATAADIARLTAKPSADHPFLVIPP